MKARFACTAVLLCVLWASASRAQPLPVYTGEHDDFTRVVVGLPAGASWAVSSESDGMRYLLDLPGSTRGFALEDFWRRIGRSRIASVSEGTSPGDLVIELACRCSVREREDGLGHLVIDFADPGKDGFELLATRASLLPAVPPSGQTAPAPRNTAAAAVAGTLGVEAAERGDGDDAFRSVIIEQFASAISAGVLDSGNADRAKTALSGFADGDIEASVVPAPVLEPDGMDCKAYDFLDTRARDSEPDTLESIAALRLELVGGGGRLDPSTVRRLIEAYLSLGLGQEALPLLDRYQGDDRVDLRRLAQLVETGGKDASDLAERLACGAGGHIWAVFARDADPSLIDADAVLASFDRWPDTLRERLGPALSRALRENGLESAARRVLDRLQRRPEDVSDALRLEAAHLSGEGNPRDFAELSTSSDENVAVAAVEAMARNPQTPKAASDLAALTESLVREYRGSGQEAELLSAHLAALISAGEYERAFQGLERDMDRESAETGSLARQIVKAALDDADEARALAFFLGRAETLAGSPDIPDAMKLAVADRLAVTQLPSKADIWLRAVGNPRLLQERALTEARAALANREPERAEIALIGQNGEAAERLRRDARQMMGDFAYLDARRSEATSPELQQDAAILAGNWRDLPEGVPAGWTSVAGLVAAGPTALDPGDLASFEALANEAGTARSSLQELLRETALTED